MSLDDHFKQTEAIRRTAIEPVCSRLIEVGIGHRDLTAALLFQAFDLLLAEAADHAETQAVFVAMADALSRHRLDELHVPNPDAL